MRNKRQDSTINAINYLQRFISATRRFSLNLKGDQSLVWKFSFNALSLVPRRNFHLFPLFLFFFFFFSCPGVSIWSGCYLNKTRSGRKPLPRSRCAEILDFVELSVSRRFVSDFRGNLLTLVAAFRNSLSLSLSFSVSWCHEKLIYPAREVVIVSRNFPANLFQLVPYKRSFSVKFLRAVSKNFYYSWIFDISSQNFFSNLLDYYSNWKLIKGGRKTEPSKISRFFPWKIAKFRGPFLKVSPSVCGGKVVSRNEISERASGGIGKGCKG